jgi:hypothetical protein
MFTGDQEGGRIRRSSQEIRSSGDVGSILQEIGSILQKRNSPGLLLSCEDLLILPFLLTSC